MAVTVSDREHKYDDNDIHVLYTGVNKGNINL